MTKIWIISVLVCLAALPAVSYGDCPRNVPCVDDPRIDAGKTSPAPLAPEAIFEVSKSNMCLHSIVPEGPLIEKGVKDMIASSFGPFFATLDVQGVCNPSGTAERFGIWTTTVVDESGRLNALAMAPAILESGENFAVLFTPGIVQKAADAVWAKQPKKVTVEGHDVVLQSMSPISFAAPNQVVNTIHGYVDTHVLGFEAGLDATTTDTLSVSNGDIQCASKTSLVIEDPIPDKTTNSGLASVGCKFAFALPTTTLTIQKFVYTRAGVSPAGIAAGANFRPFAVLVGKSIIVFDKFGEDASDTYEARVSNMRAPLKYVWTVTGGGSAAGGNPTVVTFNKAPGVSHTVKVTVTDADNLTTTAAMNVQVQIDPESIGNPHIDAANGGK